MGKKYDQITRYERMKIEALYEAGFNGRQIAQQLGRHHTTIYRELKRGKTTQRNSDWTEREIYSSDLGQSIYEENKKNCGREMKIGNDHKFVKFVEKKILKENYSPEAVLYYIKENNLVFDTDICLSTLYNYIRGGVFLNLTMVDCPNHKKKKKKKRQQVQKKLSKGTSIEERPKKIEERNEYGHWEMDSVVGPQGKGKKALVVLTERKTRDEIVQLVKDHTSAEVVRVLDKLERKMGEKKFRETFKTITVDNGTEFSDWKGMERSRRNKTIPRTSIYYCHAYRSCERATNENQNKMIRRWCPKGTIFDEYTQAEMTKIQNWMNAYPRRMFNGKSSEFMVQQEYSRRVTM
jgi:IS30 family transposase